MSDVSYVSAVALLHADAVAFSFSCIACGLCAVECDTDTILPHFIHFVFVSQSERTHIS